MLNDLELIIVNSSSPNNYSNHYNFNTIKENNPSSINQRIYGYERLPSKSEEIFIVINQNRVELLASMGYNAVCFNHKLSSVSPEQVSRLKVRCSNLLLTYEKGDFEPLEIELFLGKYSFIKELIVVDEVNESIIDEFDSFEKYSHTHFENLIDKAVTQNKISIKIDNIVVKKGKDSTVNYTNLFNSLYKAGIYKYKIDGQERFIRIINGTILQELEAFQIKDIVINEIKRQGQTYDLEKLYQGSNYYFSPSNLSNLQLKRNLPEYKGEYGVEYFFFKGKIWKIEKDSISELKYNEFKSYLWDTNMLDWYPVLEDDYFNISKGISNRLCFIHKEGYCDFLDFVFATSNIHWRQPRESLTEEQKSEINHHVINKVTVIGYLLYTFREYSCSKGVIATDYIERGAKEELGGTGKSLLGNALMELLPTYYRGARQKDFFKDKHVLGGIDNTTKLVFFDDASNRFDYDKLFTWITGKIDVNKKFHDIDVFDKERTVKFFITTNYAMLDPSWSKDRRYIYMCFSDYYGPHRTPIDDFNQELLSSNWSWEQWNRFYNFMAQCVKAYLKYGVIEPPTENIIKNQLRASINESFLDWAEDTYCDFLNKEIDKKILFEQFKASLSEIEARKVSSTSFKKNMKSFCRLKGFEFNPSKEGKDIKRNSIEYFEIFSIDST